MESSTTVRVKSFDVVLAPTMSDVGAEKPRESLVYRNVRAEEPVRAQAMAGIMAERDGHERMAYNPRVFDSETTAQLVVAEVLEGIEGYRQDLWDHGDDRTPSAHVEEFLASIEGRVRLILAKGGA